MPATARSIAKLAGANHLVSFHLIAFLVGLICAATASVKAQDEGSDFQPADMWRAAKAGDAAQLAKIIESGLDVDARARNFPPADSRGWQLAGHRRTQAYSLSFHSCSMAAISLEGNS